MTEPIGESQTYKFNHKINLFHEYYESHNRRIRDRCTVDILVPFHGNYTGVRKLVKSILENTHTNPYQITLIDDASPNAKFTEILMQAPQTKCIRLKEQKGFAGALKVGLSDGTTICMYLAFRLSSIGSEMARGIRQCFI